MRGDPAGATAEQFPPIFEAAPIVKMSGFVAE